MGGQKQKREREKTKTKKQKQSPKTGHTADLIIIICFFLKNGFSGFKIWNKNKQK